jgi:hypothetical protein
MKISAAIRRAMVARRQPILKIVRISRRLNLNERANTRTIARTMAKATA